MAMTLQDALQHFNVGLGQWYGWRKVDDDGNEIPNDQRMSYQHLIIHGDVAVKPTEQEVNDKIAELEASFEGAAYAIARADAYPTIGDQLDMLWHAIDVGDWTAAKVKTTEFYTALKAVKDANPKP